MTKRLLWVTNEITSMRAWRVECRYPTGLGHEHMIRYTVCLWTTFALTEKGDHLFICASSSHWFQALTCSNVTLFRSSKHSVVCTTDLSAGWVSPDAWQPGQASVEMQKHSLEIFTDWVWVSVESTFFAKTAQTTDTKDLTATAPDFWNRSTEGWACYSPF